MYFYKEIPNSKDIFSYFEYLYFNDFEPTKFANYLLIYIYIYIYTHKYAYIMFMDMHSPELKSSLYALKHELNIYI